MAAAAHAEPGARMEAVVSSAPRPKTDQDGKSMLAGFTRNMSHQEIERILYEVEQWWNTQFENTGLEWLPLQGIENFLFEDLGYEDIDEFEDAIQGSFGDFLNAFPNLEIKDIDGKAYLKYNPIRIGPPRKLTIRIENSAQLVDTTFLKSEDSSVNIPALEFHIGADQKRHIDSLYNHIIIARDHLEMHMKSLGDDPAQMAAIAETIEGLSSYLDVESPFVIEVQDPTSRSDFDPMDMVEIQMLGCASIPEHAEGAPEETPEATPEATPEPVVAPEAVPEQAAAPEAA